MKALDVLNKLSLLCSLGLSWLYGSGELSSLLSSDREALFRYQQEQTQQQSKTLENSWINPVVLQYSKSYSTQFGETLGSGQFMIAVDQPIFKMGGILSAIKYAKARGRAEGLDIEIQKRQQIAQALEILYNLEKSRYQLKKLELTIQNDMLDIAIQKESYEAGVTNRTLYDQALLKYNQDRTAQLDLGLSITKLENDFSLLSDEDPWRIALPHFDMIDEERYLNNQLELQREASRVEEKDHNQYMIFSKYLPEISITGRYVNEDLNPLFVQPNSSLNRAYYTYGFKVSLPINVNTFHDIQSAKIDYLNAKIAQDEKQKSIRNKFRLIQKRLQIIDQKIALSKEDEAHYQSMLTTTQELEALGDKTPLDSEIVANTLKIRQIDQAIYKLDAQLELMQLYTNVADALE